MKKLNAVIDATGTWMPETETIHYGSLSRMMNRLKGTRVHYLKVGGSNTSFNA